jgi:hypothetical protein
MVENKPANYLRLLFAFGAIAALFLLISWFSVSAFAQTAQPTPTVAATATPVPPTPAPVPPTPTPSNATGKSDGSGPPTILILAGIFLLLVLFSVTVPFIRNRQRR